MKGGGVIAAQDIHVIDLLRWFLGDIQKVVALATKSMSLDEQEDTEVKDTAVTVLGFESGAVGEVTGTFAARDPYSFHTLTLYGSKGSITVAGPPVPGPTVSDGTVAEPIRVGGEEPMQEEINHFVQCVLKNEEPLVTGLLEGMKSVAGVEAAYRSIREERVVYIDEVLR